MISCARELLTPGAWEKQGTGFRLRCDQDTGISKFEWRNAMVALKEPIWHFAKNNDGKAPSGLFGGEVKAGQWNFGNGGLYGLVPGLLFQWEMLFDTVWIDVRR